MVAAIRTKRKSAKADASGVSLFSEGLALGDVTEWIPTGFKTIDHIFGGGWPVGRASEIFGAEGTGKSALAQMAIRQCQLLGGTPMYIDFEHALDTQKIESVGIDPDNLVYSDPDHIEEAWSDVWAHIDYLEKHPPKAPCFIVWDSVGASIAKDEREGKGLAAARAAAMDSGCRKMFRRIAKVRAHMCWVNQWRVVFGGRSFITEHTTPGGAQLKYASSLRVKMFRRKITYETSKSKEVVGYECNVVTEKCRLVPPHRNAFFVLDFLYGPSEDMTMWQLLVEAKRIKVSGGGYYTCGWSKTKFKRLDWIANLGDSEFRAGAEAAYAEVAEKVTQFHGSARTVDSSEDEDTEDADT